tara:strand:- start:786 stop:1205 length:420 start_codon:yes stop_codon:yes gene_type:complete
MKKRVKKNMGGGMKKRVKAKEGKLVGGQKSLDKNNDGKISGKDFAMMPRKKAMGGGSMKKRVKAMGGGAMKKRVKAKAGKRIKAAVGTHVTKSGATANKGLWYNINKKKQRIASGSGEKMRKPGSKGAPTAKAIKQSQG